MPKQIDISKKKAVNRQAIAHGRVILKEETIQKIRNNETKKGDPLDVATIASINAVKQTQNLIPLCHQIPIDFVETNYKINKDNIEATVTVKSFAKTGVEMEALVGVSICLNTIWDMVKYLEKNKDGQYPTTKITDIKILQKIKGE
jgi:cyclic pyranopterin phosphate synthase